MKPPNFLVKHLEICKESFIFAVFNSAIYSMGIILYIVILIAACWLPKIYSWIKFKNKYPILSEELPVGILEIGDIVYLNKYKYEFLGKKNTNGLWYVFMPDDSITPCYIDRSDAIKKMTAVYGRYGIKWKKVK